MTESSFGTLHLRWLSDVGVAFLHIDNDGRVLATSAPARAGDARLRRAQALAITHDTGSAVARYLLDLKLAGQDEMLRRVPAPVELLERFTAARAALDAAVSVNEMVIAEAEAALAYWGAWAPVPVRFRRSDLPRVPDHWLSFQQRSSPLTRTPRNAANPANALLNYCYAILEAEARIACLAVGLDPTLGIVHSDQSSRDSLALDVMEAIRPQVDGYILDLLATRVFREPDFHETRTGGCRLRAPLTHQLAETAPQWRTLLAPVVERIAAMLAKTPGAKIGRMPTPLTEANRRADRARRYGRPAPATQVKAPRPERRCKRCGGELPHRDRVYCDDCLPFYQRDQYAQFAQAGVGALTARRQAGDDPSHGGLVAERRGAAISRRRQELKQWEQEQRDEPVDPAVFEREILPLIQDVPLSELMRATGLSLRYVSRIRRGEKTPHPRHWPLFVTATDDWRS